MPTFRETSTTRQLQQRSEVNIWSYAILYFELELGGLLLWWLLYQSDGCTEVPLHMKSPHNFNHRSLRGSQGWGIIFTRRHTCSLPLYWFVSIRNLNKKSDEILKALDNLVNTNINIIRPRCYIWEKGPLAGLFISVFVLEYNGESFKNR